MEDIVIVGAARSAIGKFGGSLAGVPAAKLGAHVIRKALERAGVAPDQVSEVIMGQVLTAAVGQNPARQAAIWAGLPDMVPAMTINKVCGSGLKAAMLGAQSIANGDSDIVVAGGQENMSAAPHVLNGSRDGFRMGDAKMVDSMIVDGLWDVYDEFPRHGATIEAMKGLKPAFDKNGTVTAANASGINDGAAVVILCSSKKAKELGLKPLARIKAFASAGVDPKYMGMGPVPASKRALSRAGWEPKDL